MRSAWHHDDRIRLTPQQAGKLFHERGKRCHRCTRGLSAGDDWIVEHFLALENGGKNEWDNYEITCGFCKPAKDAEDHHQAAKNKHVATKHVVPKSMRQSKFQKAPPGYDSFNRRWRDQ